MAARGCRAAASRRRCFAASVLPYAFRRKRLRLFEQRFGRAAHGADPAFGQFFKGDVAAVLVAAEGAHILACGLFFLFGDVGGGVLRRLPLDDLMIIGIGHGRVIAQDVGADHFTQKDGVGGGVHGADHAAGDVGAAVRHHGQRVFDGVGHLLEFIEVFARAEPEGADDGRVAVLRQYRYGEVPAVGDAAVGVVVFIDADHHGGGGRGDLRRAVGGAARRPAVVPGGDDVHAVRKGMECSAVHCRLLICLCIFRA